MAALNAKLVVVMGLVVSFSILEIMMSSTNSVEARHCPEEVRPPIPSVSAGGEAKNKAQVRKVVQSPDFFVGKTNAGSDDFRPTTPGNSPGVGHCANDTNDTN
ncbi:hypothetical protein Sjap_017206 [Stephania japonica]|uniref:Uncharacterized protein n=1 Tax=Stephania japonica TaxID=461633 RepID=A0AAP0I5Q8_9MAGN